MPPDLSKTIDRQTNFSWALFKGNTTFTLCNFFTPVYFWRTIFQGNISFEYTHFNEEVIWGGKQTDVHFTKACEVSPSAIKIMKSKKIFTRDLERGYGEIYMFTDIFSLQDLTAKLNTISSEALNANEREIIISEWINGSQKMFKDNSVVSFNETAFHKLDNSVFNYIDIDDVLIKSSIAGTNVERKLFLSKIKENAKDFFISHASEDKKDLVGPLVKKLTEYGKLVWFDKRQIDYGEDLYQRIENGLNNSKYCIIVLSKHFFKKRWTTLELDLILSKKNKVLFVWHGVDEEDVRACSPELAGKVAFDTDKLGNNIEALATEIILHVNRQ